ncbi:dipeptidyl aminopeptidase/acylaminoacyl peptidase [Saprospira grandis DSM 2844]|uniref:Dipeptidyl aminopeptidase/acylaminoacyl peptidase n=1 Tax=Saprospira grandis DSM 2844 TaxID=694433 RepID=J0XZW9_9BACT|nr:S9 family peptidase [Saprospira grandis]EJF54786.1 dipeptidyl aminopeptidase/acylaminoacyl peptidase [Saprospira grandis DSM 2844]
MIKHYVGLAFLLLVAAPNLVWAQEKEIQLEEIWRNYQFFSQSAQGFNFMQDGQHYSQLDDKKIREFDLKTGQESQVLFTAENGFDISGYSFGPKEEKILLETDPAKIYRYSYKANYFVYDRKSQKLEVVSEAGKQRYASFNPQADKVAFVRDNNLFYKDLQTGKELQITEDGEQNKIINGATDWVYEEEFAIDKAFFWSPDGRKIAFLRFDELAVKEFGMTYYLGNLYPNPVSFKYPKAGEKNAIVTVHLYDLESKKLRQLEVGSETDQYIPRLLWTPNNELCIYRMNRHQNQLDLFLLAADASAPKLLMSKENKYFIDIEDHLVFLKDGRFVWSDETDGYRHFYLYDKAGKLIRQLTKGKWDITDFYGVDEKNERLYFQAAAQKSTEREVYWVSLKGKKMKKLSKAAGTNSAEFSPTFAFYINKHSDINTPPSFTVYQSKGNKKLRVIEDNAPLKQRLKNYNLGKIEYFSFKNPEGTKLNGWRILPPNFDPKKEYPVFMYVYGGPSAPTAGNAWKDGNNMWFQLLAQKGYIVVSVDGRGTEPRGEAFRKATYMQLGKYEAMDQIAAANYLAGLDYVDGSRIGIFGWSFGGYLSSLCLAKGNKVFKMAIAVAPVTNWKWYDSIYTERYMRTPEENNEGYEQNSPINFVERIKGAYLLVHGFADDNVHFQHAAEMSSELINNNIPFDQQFYPNKNHGIYGGYTRLHLYNKMTKFILEEL